jgi:hypothetical protein
LDRVLRGEATRLPELSEETIQIPAGGLSVVVLGLGMVYGVCMGCFALVNRQELPDRLGQLLATTVKVPALFILTLVVTFPSLYVFNALVGTRLSLRAMLRLLVASLAVNLAVLASLGPIVAFFSISTTTAGYGFMVLLNVLVFALSGALGLTFLLQTLHRLSIARRGPMPPLSPVPGPRMPERLNPPSESVPPPVPSLPEPRADQPVEVELVAEPGALDQIEGYVLGRHVKKVFGCWVIVFGLVGAQMGWVLRPFIGSPATPFQWFRERESNFFEAVLEIVRHLF